MSERGSWITEFIYCDSCLKEVLAFFKVDQPEAQGKYLTAHQLPGWDRDADWKLPIVAGKIGGTYPGEEVGMFPHSYGEELASRLCCELRIAVLGDSGQQFFRLFPNGEVEWEQPDDGDLYIPPKPHGLLVGGPFNGTDVGETTARHYYLPVTATTAHVYTFGGAESNAGKQVARVRVYTYDGVQENPPNMARLWEAERSNG